MNDLFSGIRFSHEDKIQEHILESLLLGRRTKGNFACYFHSFLQVPIGALCRKSQILTRRSDRLKPGKSLNRIWHIGDETGQFSISLL